MSPTSATVIILIVVSCGIDISAKENYQALLTKYVCKVLDSSLVANFTCSLTNSLNKFNQTTSQRSQELVFHRGVKLYNYYVHLQLYRKYGNVYRPYLINIEQDMCALLGKDRNTKNVSLLRKLLRFDADPAHGNYFAPCPFSGTRYEKNVETETITMAGAYRMDIIGYTMVNAIRTNITFTEISGAVRIIS